MKVWNFKITDSFSTELTPIYVFFRRPAVEAWLKTYTPLRNMQPVYISASTRDNRAFLPLLLWHRNWKNLFITDLIPVGYSDFDYHDPIFQTAPNSESLAAFWSELIPFLKSNLKFDRLLLDGISDAAVGDVDNMKELTWQQKEICPMLKFGEIKKEEQLWGFLKTSLRGDIRRQMRRLSEIGELSLVEYDSWENVPQTSFSEFMRQHSLRWPNAYKAPHFHENLLKEGLSTGTVHFSVLKAGNTEVAWHLGFEDAERYYYYMPAGNRDYAKFSPTKVHLFLLVKRAMERGVNVFDHLRGEENYKSGWSNDSQYVNTLRVDRDAFSTRLKLRLNDLLHSLKP